MSGIVGVFNRDGRPVDGALLESLLAAVADRGSEHVGLETVGHCGLGVARDGWELGNGFSGPVLIAVGPGLLVAADAALYYRAELVAKLEKRGVVATASTPAHLILAAYEAWGDRCVEELEGDFAFAVWDARLGRLFCARDVVGMRPLYFAELADTVVVGSTVSAVLQHPRCPRDVNLGAVADLAGGLFAADDETCYRSVSLLPAAHVMVFHADRAERRRFWSPPPPTPFRGADFEEGARELRGLIGRAVIERLDPGAISSVWLSGGWDSTAVFAAGMHQLRNGADSRALQPVSLSYPRGDAGREDELIELVLAHWGVATKWIGIEGVQALDPEFPAQAGRTDDAFFHPYETWNRALAEGSRSLGARVALTGNGGDALFQVSPMYLSDLVLRGQWLTFSREWRRKGFRGSGRFLRWVVRPALPPGLAALIEAVRGGRAWRHPLDRGIAPWVLASRVRLRRAQSEEQRFRRDQGAWGSVARELLRYYGDPYLPRVTAEVTGIALSAGVELRHPLFDRRIIEFALRRPWRELASGPDTKRLLRKAMEGLLPEPVLRTRPHRTGVSHEFLERGTRELLPDLIRHWFQDSRLAELGIVDVRCLLEFAELYRAGNGLRWVFPLLWTLRAELWVRSNMEADAPGAPPDPLLRLAATAG